MTASADGWGAARAAWRRLGAACALALVVVLLAGTARADDDLPEPVIRQGPAVKREAGPIAPGPQVPAQPVLPPRVPLPREPPPRVPPPRVPPPRVPPPRVPPRPLAPGELPEPQIRRIGHDPTLRVPGPDQPLYPVPAPARPGVTPAPGGFPSRPPPPPSGTPESEPGDVTFDVEESGLLQGVDQGGGIAAIVMTGNPRIHRSGGQTEGGAWLPELSVKANRIVAWVDPSAFPQLKGLGALRDGVGGRGSDAETGGVRIVDLGDEASIIPAALLEIYAEGAVELTFDDMSFRADRLYLDAREHVALLVAPRVDLQVAGQVLGVEKRIPLHVRAQRARLVGRGILVFDQAEASTSRADDRIALRIEELTVQEFEDGSRPGGSGEPHLLGFRRSSTQTFTGRRIQVRGERVPLLYVPTLEFGLSSEGDPFPSVIRGLDIGRRGSLGWFGFLELGGTLEPGGQKIGSWTANVGGYLERGPALGGGIEWNTWRRESGLQGFGLFRTDGVYDSDGHDRSGFIAPEPLRWRVLEESRTRVAEGLHFDFEFADFSDSGYNLEFFEREQLEHKPYESYGRLYWKPESPGSIVATATGKWHQRDFVTETTLLPQIGLWAFGVPIHVPASRGGLGIDINSVSDVGHLERRFMDGDPTANYAAYRASTTTTVNASGEIGDLKLTGYAGGSIDSYWDRNDMGEDLTRTALVAGASANVQLSRQYAARGGPLDLDGLRHVIDVDLGYAGRFFDSANPSEVPSFDRRETVEARSTVILRARNRLQTRRTPDPSVRSTGAARGLRSVVDLDTAVYFYPLDRGPYFRDSRGAFEGLLTGNLTNKVNVFGQTWVDFDQGYQYGSIGAGYQHGAGEPGTIIARAALSGARDLSLAVRGDVAWRYSDKYGAALDSTFDFRKGASVVRLVLRRYSLDHIVEFGFRVRQGEDFGFEFSIEPAIGGVPTKDPRIFQNAPSLNPDRGTFSP